jgi:hypothetical protein
MKIERAIEILDPEHREHYEGLEEVNEACRMGMAALRVTRNVRDEKVGETELPRFLLEAAELMEKGVYLPGHRAAMRRAAALLERAAVIGAED